MAWHGMFRLQVLGCSALNHVASKGETANQVCCQKIVEAEAAVSVTKKSS
jgi:hypothetical protein